VLSLAQLSPSLFPFIFVIFFLSIFGWCWIIGTQRGRYTGPRLTIHDHIRQWLIKQVIESQMISWGELQDMHCIGDERNEVLRNRNRISWTKFWFLSNGTGFSVFQSGFLSTGAGISKDHSSFNGNRNFILLPDIPEPRDIISILFLPVVVMLFCLFPCKGPFIYYVIQVGGR